MNKLFLVIDLGTSSVKVVAYDNRGNAVASAKGDYPVHHPQPDWAEQAPEDWWARTSEAVRRVAAQVPPGSVAAVSACSQREGMVPVDERCNALLPCIIWLDMRTGAQGERIERELGLERGYGLTGLRPGPAWSLPKLMWIRENEPKVFDAAYKFVQPGDFILARLSGRFVEDFSMASRTMMFEPAKRCWCPEILDHFGIPAGKMPQLIESGSVISEIRPEAAQELGLDEGTLIVAGGGDQQCAGIGVGAVGEGKVGAGIGTGTALVVDLKEPKIDPAMSIPLNCHAVPGHWEYEPCLWISGGLLSWFCDEFYRDSGRGFETMIAEVAGLPAGADGLTALPYFVGAGSPNWHPQAEGVFAGVRPGHKRGHFARALFEAIAMEIRLNLEAVQANGVNVSQIVLSGGASRNEPLCRIVASALPVPVAVTENADAASLGAAMLAALGAGEFDCIEDAVAAMRHPDRAIAPDPAAAKRYDKTYDRYRELYRSLRGYFGGRT
ncbi:MAG TPA: FGGY family carbohydrate kinase [Candidatus Brocadiia bacterium]|nr:FGGY family carbohydrate kinase [Candidatus Brocadiia bacterium]